MIRPKPLVLAFAALPVIGAITALVVTSWAQSADSDPKDSLTTDSSSDVERAENGEILHRRLPGSGGGDFIYDPQATETSLPSELHRDGNTHPAPKLTSEPDEGEAVYSKKGVRSAQATPGESPVAAGAPLAATGGAGSPPGTGAPGSPGAAATGAAGAAGGKPNRKNGPPVVDPRAFLGNRAAPDRETEREGRLDYHAVFDPSIVPFKRNRALNRVGPDYEVLLEPAHFQEITPNGIRTEPGREAFWGSILLEGKAGQRIPLPSVAPSSRILTADVVPAVSLKFLKDSADNFYAVPAKSGRFRLVFVMDAPTRYFGRELPGDSLRLSDVPRHMVARLPARVRQAALQFASELGLSRRSSFSTALRALVSHFRGFEPGAPPPSTRDIYLDLARGKKGICRHRSFGFVVTALALGIPARYVFNEAHVFVEVYLPGSDPGWLRVDLGGGANELFVHSAQDKLQHQPRGRDPFEQPDQAASDTELAGAATVHGAPPRSRAREPSSASGGSRSTAPRTMRFKVPTPVSTPGARETRTSLSLSRSHSFRGDGVTAYGRVSDASGDAAKNGTVQIILAMLDARTMRPIRLLATAALDETGRFEVTFTYPKDQAPGNYEVKAQFMGSGRLNPSISP